MINIISSTDKGIVRKENQDYYCYHIYENNNMAFAVVCDGMGGYLAGDVASRLACDIIKEQILKTDIRALNPVDIKNVLESALSVANAMVFELSEKEPNLNGMGTTATAVFIIDNQAFIMYAGDSRAYLTYDKNCVQITKDHTLVQNLVDNGKLTAEQAKSFPDRQKITKALGVLPYLDTDYIETEIPKNCSILICTDGLSNYMENEDVLRLSNEALEENSADVFINFALSEGGADNITAVLITRRAD